MTPSTCRSGIGGGLYRPCRHYMFFVRSRQPFALTILRGGPVDADAPTAEGLSQSIIGKQREENRDRAAAADAAIDFAIKRLAPREASGVRFTFGTCGDSGDSCFNAKVLTDPPTW